MNIESQGFWRARDREDKQLAAMEAARTARYGSQYCKGCGQTYRVDPDTMAAEEHVCTPASKRRDVLGM